VVHSSPARSVGRRFSLTAHDGFSARKWFVGTHEEFKNLKESTLLSLLVLLRCGLILGSRSIYFRRRAMLASLALRVVATLHTPSVSTSTT
jgi:hypothetical protein